MAHAWLDSLSEDWVSQPRSDDSAVQLPTLPQSDSRSKSSSHDQPSRIPRRTVAARSSAHAGDTSVNILSERSASEINVSMSRAAAPPSKSVRSEGDHRAVSESSNGSVIHNSVRHQSSGRAGHTPEWKRRLVQGEMAYGEQRDLFCSAAEGLQDMFKPPAPMVADIIAEELLDDGSTMGSSPPVPHRRSSVDLAEEVEDYTQEDLKQVTPSPSPRKAPRDIKYKLNVEDMSGMFSSPSIAPGQRFDSRNPAEETFQDDSRLSAVSGVDPNSRKASGQSDTRNEDFSPIMIGKHSGKEGGIEFGPVEMPADQLKAKLERLRINQALLDSEADIEQAFDNEDASHNFESTDEFARQGGFLNTRRGGRSAEGSFRYRGLSPVFAVDTSEMLAEESLQASTPKQFPTIRTDLFGGQDSLRSPTLPRAPFPSPEKRQARNTKENEPPGGSPLKLFGPYDTFTNQTLLRRISQFEEGMSGNPSQQSLGSPQSDVSVFVQSPRLQQAGQSPSGPGSADISEFGAGDLDGYEFSGDLSVGTGAGAEDKENVSPPRPFPSAPVFDAPINDSSPEEESEIYIRRRRNKSLSSSASKHRRVVSKSDQLRMSALYAQSAIEDLHSPKRDTGSDSKRPRTSPSKDPTPKRRRTLHKSDIAFGREQLAGINSTHRQMQSAITGAREELQASTFELAHPSSLSARSILRPRLPSGKLTLAPDEHSLRPPSRSPRGMPRVQAGHFPMSGGPESVKTDRKPSIRTQDFVDQAAHIMAMIRNQVKPGLASLEESGEENGEPSPALSDSVGSDSSREPFSRPPSREGRAALRRPLHRQDDPELMNRLKKYQERSDLGDLITSSLRSMDLAQDAVLATTEADSFLQHRNHPFNAAGGEVVSDIPNVRITTNPFHHQPTGSPPRDFPSHSSGQISNGSYNTGSSRNSDSRKTIMPESVSHLIPERVGSMCLDKAKNVWIKNKEPAPVEPQVPPSDSEDDPFASIPDLSVDLTKELQNLRLTTARKEQNNLNPEDAESPTSPTEGQNQAARPKFFTFSPEEYLEAQAEEAASRGGSPMTNSSQLRSEQELDELPVKPESPGENVPVSASGRRRNITISFSSPVASIIQEVQPEDLDSLEDDPQPGMNDEHSGPESPIATSKARPVLKKSRAASRQNSTKRHDFVPRPVSRIDEQDEDSSVELPHDDQRQLSLLGETSLISHKTPDGRRTSVSFILNGHSVNQALSIRGDDSAIIGQNVGKLSLSPLSEFTMNNSDQSFGFEVSYVMGRRHMETGEGVKKVMSMTIRDLVDKLSEVEPFEPYWEDIEALDIQDKRLTSLHMLDEFCGKIVTLDASKNALAHLEGVPSTVRSLKVSENMLTELTSWNHLNNLQYIDISGNEVKSLSALKNLVHLRSIKADNNQLTSLDGLDCHDGLLSLRARNNLLEDVDFGLVRLDRLSDLDLAGNEIRSVEGLEQLPSLSKLKLSKNKLQQLNFDSTITALRQLDVSDNELEALDLSRVPSLHSLHADRNRISHITGFTKTRRLDSLSLREQRGEEALDFRFLSAACEIRKLFLSGNYLRTFEPQVDFLNLQLLELANCGLQSLPESLGQLMPNVRTLNLNFNAISDLSPLRFIPRLKKMLAVGNRLADSTTVTELLTDFPHLAQLDLRDNPVTLGFYAPLQVLVPTKEGGEVADPFVLPPADVERDELFATRLDETTRLRRRLHQVVFSASCKRLRVLDGLPLNRHAVFTRDEVFQKLVSEELLPPFDEAANSNEAPTVSAAPNMESADDQQEHVAVVEEDIRAPSGSSDVGAL
jgi:protein NUD1